MKTFLTKSGVLLCTLCLASLYLLGLSRADGVPVFGVDFHVFAWDYLLYLTGFCILGLSAAWFLRAVPKPGDSGLRRWYPLLPITVSAGLLFLFHHFGSFSGYTGDLPENFFRFILPVVFWGIGITYTRLAQKKEVLRRFLYPSYFLTVILLTALSSFWYNSLNICTYHPVNLIYLIVSAVLVLRIAQNKPFKDWFFCFNVRKLHESPFLWVLFTSIALFSANKRFTDILATWNAPAAPVYGDPYAVHFPNWFAYRVTVLAENLTQRIESIQLLNARRIPLYNSAAWLYQVYGILPVLAVLVFLAGIFLLLHRCTKHSGRFVKYLYAVLLLRTVLGLLANLLLVYSAEITPLMMGYMPFDVVFVILILLTRADRNEP